MYHDIPFSHVQDPQGRCISSVSTPFTWQKILLIPGVWNKLVALLVRKYCSSLGATSKSFEMITIAKNALISAGDVSSEPLTSFWAAFLFVNLAISYINSLSKNSWKYCNADRCCGASLVGLHCKEKSSLAIWNGVRVQFISLSNCHGNPLNLFSSSSSLEFNISAHHHFSPLPDSSKDASGYSSFEDI